MNRNQRTCCCDDYEFPHRYGGGKCNEPERRDERERESWLRDATRRELLDRMKAVEANVD